MKSTTQNIQSDFTSAGSGITGVVPISINNFPSLILLGINIIILSLLGSLITVIG